MSNLQTPDDDNLHFKFYSPNYVLMTHWLRYAVRLVLAIIIFAASGSATTSPAEPISPWLYRAYQTEDGLPDISITGVTQTQDGYLWVATKGGLDCFNGLEFRGLPRANLPTFPSRAVRAMLCDQRDWLWLGMERGPVLCFKPDGLERFTVTDGLLVQRVVMMAEDRDGAVWITYPTQLRRILNGQVQRIALPKSWSDVADLVVASDRQGNIWCAKGTQLGVWREGAWQSTSKLPAGATAIGARGKSSLWISAGGRLFACTEGQAPVEVLQMPPNVEPRLLFEDRSGALWIGTSLHGLFRWDGRHLESAPTSDRAITCLNEDREGNIWAGTDGGGLNLVRVRTVALLGSAAGLPFESVFSVTEDREGWVWAAAQGGQLARGKDGRWETPTNWPGSLATCVAADQAGGVWVGTSDRGLKYFRDGVWREWLQRDGLVNDRVRSVLVASNGDVWAASMSPNRLQRVRDGQVRVMRNSTPLGPIRALAEGADGTIWIGSSEGEIQKVQGDTLVVEPAIAEPVPLSVRSLLTTADGSLWIGYAGDGLGHFQAGKYQRLTTAAGLTDDFISQLLPDGSGSLWLTGNRGLSRVSFAELDAVIAGRAQRVSARAYGSADGLPGLQPNRDYSPSAWPARDGRLWFATRSGLLVVEPQQIRDNPHPPPVQLEGVSVDDQLVAVYNAGSPLQTQPGTNVVNLRTQAAPLSLGPGHRKVEINFAALSFASPENVQFRYRLTGFDNNWVEAGSRHSALYPHLPAGDYEFRVLACNNSGVWNETGAQLAFAVSPYFWETWWFRIGGGVATTLLAAGVAFAASRRRYRQKLRRLEARRALEQERARIAKDIHDDLGSSLTHISLLSQSTRGGPEDAEAAVASLAQIHRTARDLTQAMGEVVWAVNPEHDSFDSLANYLSQYAQSFLKVAGIRCRIEMPMALPKQPLSAEVRHNLFLAFKEALNNVAKHAGASEVQIALIPGDAGFELLVADNGKGGASAINAPQPPGHQAARATPGNGLANMRNRMQEIGGGFELRSEPGQGTSITFRIKLKADHGQP